MHARLVVVFALAGCGSDGVAIDAAPRPDAIPPDLSCADQPLPTTASDPIVIDGHAYAASPLGQEDLAQAIIEAFPVSGGAALVATNSDAAGLYTLTIANPGMTPLDGYLRGRATSYLDTYLYPPSPLAADIDESPMMFTTADTLDQLAFTSGAGQSPTLGFLGVLVQDCAGNPVAGATVTIAPTSTSPETVVVYVAPNNFPDTAATSTRDNGLAYVFNVPIGEVVVDAEVGDTALHEHPITSRAGAVTTTAVAPGL